eukprot:g56545.t1
MEGVVVFQVQDARVDPVQLVTHMLQEVQRTKESRSRYTIRLLPLQVTSYCSSDKLAKAAGALLSAAFGCPQTLSYCIQLKRRSKSEEIDRDACIRALAQQVPMQHVVDFKAPDRVVLVQTLWKVAGLAVIDGPAWRALHEFNLPKLLAGKPAAAKKPSSQAKRQSAKAEGTATENKAENSKEEEAGQAEGGEERQAQDSKEQEAGKEGVEGRPDTSVGGSEAAARQAEGQEEQPNGEAGQQGEAGKKRAGRTDAAQPAQKRQRREE